MKQKEFLESFGEMRDITINGIKFPIYDLRIEKKDMMDGRRTITVKLHPAIINDDDEFEVSVEKKILDLIENRLELGRNDYGLFNLKRDKRDFVKETLEEVADGLVYVAAKLLQLKESEAGDE